MELWIVGQRLEGDGWLFAGVFDNRPQAVACCRDTSMFVAPAKLNAPVPLQRIEWDGAFFPLAERVTG